MEKITKTEYLHKTTKTVWQHTEEFAEDTEMYYCFQQSEEPSKLGFTYERDYSEAKEQESETI